MCCGVLSVSATSNCEHFCYRVDVCFANSDVIAADVLVAVVCYFVVGAWPLIPATVAAE